MSALIAVCFVVLLHGASKAEAQQVQLATESYHIPAADPGVQLYVRNKRPAGMTSFTPERTLLFVHGATYPAEVSFDLQLDGFSWMDFIARQGYDVYLVDVRGYGRSTRPPEMSGPADRSRPIVHTDVAVRDFGTAVDHVLQRRSLERLSIMGWSWGTVIVGAYASMNSHKIVRLVLYAPVWVEARPTPAPSAISAYRTVSREVAERRWLNGVPETAQQALIPPGWFDAWWNANMEADPVGASQNPPVVRAPNGVVEDDFRFWSSDRRFYDPAGISVPVLIILGEWDADTPPYMSQAVFERLSSAPAKRLVLIGEGTHSVIMERNRMQLFSEVQLFLDGR